MLHRWTLQPFSHAVTLHAVEYPPIASSTLARRHLLERRIPEPKDQLEERQPFWREPEMLGNGSMRRLAVVLAFRPRVRVATVVFEVEDGHDAIRQRLFEGGSLKNEFCQERRLEVVES